MKLYFDDEGFDGQLQRTVGKCDAGMANVGECLYIASRITAGDRDSWFAEWSTFADGLVAQAAAAEQAGHATTAARLGACRARHVRSRRRPARSRRPPDRARRPLVRRAAAPRGAAGTPRLAALIVDPGQYDMAAGVAARLGELWQHVDDPAAKAKFDALLEIPAMRTLLGPRMVTNGVADPQTYFQDMRRYTNAELAASITCPSFVTDNETDLVSTGQGQHLYDAMTCQKAFRRFTRAEGAEGHCEGMAPIVFWTAAFDWLDTAVR